MPKRYQKGDTMSLFHDKVSPRAVIMSNLRHIQGLERLLEILEVFRKSACTGLLVKGRKVLSGLLHHLDHMIKGHAVLSIGESGVEIRVKGTGGGESVSLDTWDLYQAADRIAGHSQMVFQPHLGGIFNLRRTATEKLARGGGSHRARHPHLTLTADLGTRDGGVPFDYIPDDPGCSQSVKHTNILEIMPLRQW